MVQIIISFVISIVWFLQGFVFGFQFQFALENPIFYILGYMLQAFSLYGSIIYLALGVLLIVERASSHDKNFSVGMYYNIMIAVGLLLVIGTTL